VAWILLLVLQQPPGARDDIGRGPLVMPSLSPFQSLRSGLLPRTPSALRAGEGELRFSTSWVNIWAFNEDDWILDVEVLDGRIGIAWGASDRATLFLEVEERARFGGELDRVIDHFHELTRAEQRHRDDFARDDVRFEVDRRDGRPPLLLGKGDRGVFERAIVVGAQWGLLGSPAVDASPKDRSEGPSRGRS
jgi:hypothetical protein